MLPSRTPRQLRNLSTQVGLELFTFILSFFSPSVYFRLFKLTTSYVVQTHSLMRATYRFEERYINL